MSFVIKVHWTLLEQNLSTIFSEGSIAYFRQLFAWRALIKSYSLCVTSNLNDRRLTFSISWELQIKLAWFFNPYLYSILNFRSSRGCPIRAVIDPLTLLLLSREISYSIWTFISLIIINQWIGVKSQTILIFKINSTFPKLVRTRMIIFSLKMASSLKTSWISAIALWKAINTPPNSILIAHRFLKSKRISLCHQTFLTSSASTQQNEKTLLKTR